MKHLGYLAMLLFTLFGSLWLEFIFHLGVLKQLKRLALTIIPVAIIFISWDVAATRLNDWGFDPRQTLDLKPLLKLPIEEIAFFLIVPLAAILTIEAVLYTRKRWRV